MQAKDIMSAPVIAIDADATLEKAAALMLAKRVGGLPVTGEGGALIGFLTEGDFVAREQGIPFSFVRAPQILGQWLGKDGVERIYAESRRLRVRDVMTQPAISLAEDASVEDVALTMMKRDIKRIVIVRDGAPVGIVARHDLLRLLLPASAP